MTSGSLLDFNTNALQHRYFNYGNLSSRREPQGPAAQLQPRQRLVARPQLRGDTTSDSLFDFAPVHCQLFWNSVLCCLAHCSILIQSHCSFAILLMLQKHVEDSNLPSYRAMRQHLNQHLPMDLLPAPPSLRGALSAKLPRPAPLHSPREEGVVVWQRRTVVGETVVKRLVRREAHAHRVAQEPSRLWPPPGAPSWVLLLRTHENHLQGRACQSLGMHSDSRQSVSCD